MNTLLHYKAIIFELFNKPKHAESIMPTFKNVCLDDWSKNGASKRILNFSESFVDNCIIQIYSGKVYDSANLESNFSQCDYGVNQDEHSTPDHPLEDRSTIDNSSLANLIAIDDPITLSEDSRNNMLSNALYQLTGTMDVKDTDQFQFVLKLIHSLKKQVSMKRKDPEVDLECNASMTNICVCPMEDHENNKDKSDTTILTNSTGGGLPFPNLISASHKNQGVNQSFISGHCMACQFSSEIN
jgi:hypothetical protein